MKLYPTNAQRQQSRDNSATLLTQCLDTLGIKYISCENDPGVGKYLDELAGIDFYLITERGWIPCAARCINDKPDRCISLRMHRIKANGQPGEATELDKLKEASGTKYAHPTMLFKFYFANNKLVDIGYINTNEFLNLLTKATKDEPWYVNNFPAYDDNGSKQLFTSLTFDYLTEHANTFTRIKL